jgi:CxxC-x17-CxxC domain-containing protein
MKNFNGGDRRGGGGFRGGKPAFQNKSWGVDRGEKPMFKATCSECGKSCEVPFRPTGEKPVFCSDCFNKMRDPSDSRGGRSESSDRGPKRDFNDRHAPRPEYSAPRDPRAPYKPAPANDNTSKQLSDISFKLDKLISAIEKMTVAAQPKLITVNTTKLEVKKQLLPTKEMTPKKVAKVKVVTTPAKATKKVVAKKKK